MDSVFLNDGRMVVFGDEYARENDLVECHGELVKFSMSKFLKSDRAQGAMCKRVIEVVIRL